MIGVSLTDTQLDIQSPLKPGIAILQKDDVRRLLDSSNPFEPETLEAVLDQVNFWDTDEFFLAVKFGAKKDEDASVAAEIVAQEFMSLLMFYALVTTGCASCGLRYRINLQSRICLGLQLTNRWSVSFALASTLMFPERPESAVIKCSADQLLPTIFNSDVGPIADIVLAKRGEHFHDSVMESIKAATRSLSDAMYASLPGDSVARVITTFEVLLKQEQDRDQTIKKRLSILLGSHYKQLEPIYDARNRLVHQGISVDKKFAVQSIIIALRALVAYCTFIKETPKQTSRHLILTWMDIQSTVNLSKHSEKLRSLWNHFESARDRSAPNRVSPGD